MQQSLLTPPKNVPFAVRQTEGGIFITVEKDAAHHNGLSELRSTVWIRGVTVPVHIDLSSIGLLSSALIGWMFGLIHEGKLKSLSIGNANRRVLMQMQQVGLSGFVHVEASSPVIATVDATLTASP